MPELPEVEITLLEIKPWLMGQSILRIEVRNTQLRWPIAKEIMLIHNQPVLNIQRRAKYLLLELKTGWIIIHLGMSGCLRILVKYQSPGNHDHIDLIISNGCIIRYTDPRRFGAWLWSKNPYTHRILVRLGPEPLSDNFDGSWLYKKSRYKYLKIKPWLMDNRIVAGMGNIYANESLFIAGISPNRNADSLCQKETILLADAIKTILIHSIKQGGTTLRNFLQPNGKKGSFVNKLQVYGRSGKSCQVCGTLIQLTKHNNRSTFFCSKCQY